MVFYDRYEIIRKSSKGFIVKDKKGVLKRIMYENGQIIKEDTKKIKVK